MVQRLLFLVVQCALLCSCVVAKQEASFVEFQGDTRGPSAFWARVDTGREYSSASQYNDGVRTDYDGVIGPGTNVQVDLGESASADLDTTFGYSDGYSNCSNGSCSQGIGGQLGRYYITLGPAKSGQYIAGCVSQVTDWKYALRLHRIGDSGGGTQLFDLHFVTYTKNGGKCMGIYESEGQWPNACVCFRDFVDFIKGAIINAALAVGISYAVAEIIAALSAPIIAVGLVL